VLPCLPIPDEWKPASRLSVPIIEPGHPANTSEYTTSPHQNHGENRIFIRSSCIPSYRLNTCVHYHRVQHRHKHAALQTISYSHFLRLQARLLIRNGIPLSWRRRPGWICRSVFTTGWSSSSVGTLTALCTVANFNSEVHHSQHYPRFGRKARFIADARRTYSE